MEGTLFDSEQHKVEGKLVGTVEQVVRKAAAE